jgi:hypothetical protein
LIAYIYIYIYIYIFTNQLILRFLTFHPPSPLSPPFSQVSQSAVSGGGMLETLDLAYNEIEGQEEIKGLLYLPQLHEVLLYGNPLTGMRLVKPV